MIYNVGEEPSMRSVKYARQKIQNKSIAIIFDLTVIRIQWLQILPHAYLCGGGGGRVQGLLPD